jgi:predicted methyltransferase
MPRRSIPRAAGAAALFGSALLVLGACTSPGTPQVADATATKYAAALTPAQIATVLAGPDRSDADRTNDKRRKPDQMLAFIGVRPGMVVLDLSAGGGYTTELLARSVGPTGRVYGQTAPRVDRVPPAQPEGAATPPAPLAASAAPGTTSRTAPASLAARVKNPAAGNILIVVQPFESPVPPELASSGLDLVTLMFNYHDLGHMGVDRAAMNRAVFAALKPGGLYVLADHSGRSGTGISEAGTLHRVEESFLRAEVEQAGFKLQGEGHFLRNPSDPRDRNTPEPPQPKDEFVLKFVRP